MTIEQNKNLGGWFNLDLLATEEMEQLESLLFGLAGVASSTEDSGTTFDPYRLAPALYLALDLVAAIKDRMSEISEETRQYYIKTKALVESSIQNTENEVKAA